ncbi:hypothetical protein Dimus_039263 [Dionaea muscipula]
MEIEEEQASEFLEEDSSDKQQIIQPAIGMIFESDTEALQFYRRYAFRQGFGVMIKSSKKVDGMKVYVSFCCSRSGKPKDEALDPLKSHPTTKTDCKASIHISKQKFDGKWKLNSMVLKHNHDMDLVAVKYLRSNRYLPPHAQRLIENNCRVGIKMNKTINSMEQKVGGGENLSWMEKDARNHMDRIRRHELKGGDVQAMLQYFQRMQADNKNFFYAIDLDEENRLKNVFWADARSRESYKEFGDAVTFDTTYLVNKFDMPFAPFVGINHHGQSILFGCGLVTKEDTVSFVWLFEAWMSCMIQCHPNAIITDQCRAMQNAISQVKKRYNVYLVLRPMQ